MPWSIKELKSRGLAAFKANYWPCVAVAFLSLVVGGGFSFSVKNSVSGNASTAAVSASSGENASSETDLESGGTPSASSPTLWQRLKTVRAGGGRPSFSDAVVVAFFAVFLLAVLVASLLFRFLLLNPLWVGCANFFFRNASAKADFNTVAAPFRTWKRVAKTMFLRDLYLSLWALPGMLLQVGLTLRLIGMQVDESALHSFMLGNLLAALLLLPFIVKLYSYRLVPYLLADDPALSGRAAVTRSRVLMDGHKAHAFLLDLSFIGWYILSVLTLGILLIFRVAPHVQATNAALYRALSAPPPAPTPPPLP
jgi:uncharacterized membrane protein